MEITINPQLQAALDVLEKTNTHLFITGKAGTGKSTLLTHWRDTTKKNVVVLAPTGVAALNVRGQTIHSFFRFKPDITVDKIRPLEKGDEAIGMYKKIETIVIDEISMVRADLLDCIDTFLRLNGPQKYLAFGGVQMVFIGDLYQLPPVVKRDQEEIFRTHYTSPYFFSAHVFDPKQKELFHLGNVPTFERIELDTIFRQKDRDFIDILNAIRTNTVETKHLDALSSRWDSFFIPGHEEYWITLTTTNAAAQSINDGYIDQLQGKAEEYRASTSGDVGSEYFPTDEVLRIKVGAQVMFVNNDREGRWVNGTIGQVTGITEDIETGTDAIMVELPEGDEVAVLPNAWEVFRWTFDKDEKKLVSENSGTFTQYPLRLAWAITIHKSQGKTFDRVIIDIGTGAFVSGQLYVALSRCKTLEGIVLTRQIKQKDVMMDNRVVRFMNGEEIERDEYPQRTHTSYLHGHDNPRDTTSVKEIIQQAIIDGKTVNLVYQSGEKQTKRQIIPSYVGEMSYNGKQYIGFEGHCLWLNETRSFRLDKIISITVQ